MGFGLSGESALFSDDTFDFKNDFANAGGNRGINTGQSLQLDGAQLAIAGVAAAVVIMAAIAFRPKGRRK